MIRLNIGCGREYREGWKNLDISKGVKADYYLDIRTAALPFDDSSADEIYISGVLEQILVNEEFLFAMNECNRVLKPGGKMQVVVPNAKYSIAHQDPMDCRKFTEPTWQYFVKGERRFDLFGSVYGFLPWTSAQPITKPNGIMMVNLVK